MWTWRVFSIHVGDLPTLLFLQTPGLPPSKDLKSPGFSWIKTRSQKEWELNLVPLLQLLIACCMLLLCIASGIWGHLTSSIFMLCWACFYHKCPRWNKMASQKCGHDTCDEDLYQLNVTFAWI